MTVFMTSEVKRRLQARNVVASDDGGGKNTPTVTLSGYYWGKINRSKQDILQHRVVCVKINQGAEVSHRKDVHHKNDTTKNCRHLVMQSTS